MTRFPSIWPGRPIWGKAPIRVEEFEEDSTLVVRAEMPDLDPDKDVEIDVSDQTVRIRVLGRHEPQIEERHRRRSELVLAQFELLSPHRLQTWPTPPNHDRTGELRAGGFSRLLPLPADATDQDVKATYNAGILDVRIPIDHGTTEPRKIPVLRT
jgi:HSP20 family protein